MRVLFLALALLFAVEAEARERSAAVRCQFLKSQGYAKCKAPPGHEVDHRRALCAGGLDHPSNLQILTVEQHRAKTKVDRKECRR
jgi:hypothetical protein